MHGKEAHELQSVSCELAASVTRPRHRQIFFLKIFAQILDNHW
jgi:hypothetical protein